MSQMIKLDITQACYEGLRCSVCSGYLSFIPIRLLPDGSAICARCSPPNNAVPYRGLIVENLLSNTAFPCRYKEFGCSTNVMFNNVLNHEGGCIHRPFPCASLPHTSCSWRGSVSQVVSHFAEKHSNFIQQEAKIKLHVNQNKEDVLLVKEFVIIKYVFNAAVCSLRYQIRLCMMDVDDQNCKLQLFNDLDLDYCLTLRAKCFAYNTDLYNDSLLRLDLGPIIVALNNPETLTVIFHVKVPIAMGNSSASSKVDYKLLDSNRCAQCQYYLIPPLFDLSSKIICGDCSSTYGSIPTTNQTLENLLTLQNFPCRWRGCNFIGKGDVIRRHQTECDFRRYLCKFGCGDTFKRSCAKLHMEGHNCRYFSDKYVHTFTFQYESHKTSVFTIVDYEMIVIVIDLPPSTSSLHCKYYRLSIYNTDPAAKLAGAVYFSHQHCKCQSKKFSTSSAKSIQFSELPTCFKLCDVISATIEIEKS